MTNQFKQKIYQASQKGQSVCEQLERGQANTPLADHFRQIEADVDSAPFSVVLLGLTTNARTAALAWLYGEEFSVLSVNVVQQLGLVEIYLRERGYTLDSADGERLEFDQLAPFMDALTQSDVLSPYDGKSWVDPIRLGVNSPKGLQGVKVYMPESPQMVLKNPGLLNRVVTQANLLVVAAPLHYVLTDQDQQAILEISQNMDGFWPLLIVDELDEEASLPKIGWWQQHNAPTVQLKPQLLTTHIAANIPSMLQDIDDATRQTLFLYLQTRRIVGASEAVKERSGQELRQLKSRRNRELRRAKAGEDRVKVGKIARHQWDELRNGITDEVARLQKRLQEQGKRSLLPDGPLLTQLDEFVGKLQVTDLDQESGHQSIKLTVKDDFLEELKTQLKVLLKQQFKSDVLTVSSSLIEQQKNLEEQVKSLTQQPQILPILPLDDKQVWSSQKEQLNISVRYRGEMPKRGFMSRLSDGRKAIMGMSMMSMVIGGMFKAVWGVDFRAIIMIVAPLFFIAAIVYSFIVWPKEDAERLDKELEKVRDGLGSELKRLLSELQRDKQSKINNHLDEQKKAILRKLDDLMRVTQAQQDNAMNDQREQAQKHLQQIEQQTSELQATERDIQALNRQCEALENEGKQQLKALS